MSEELETMSVTDKETGEQVIINVADYDPEKHEMMVGEEEMAGDDAEAEPEADDDSADPKPGEEPAGV